MLGGGKYIRLKHHPQQIEARYSVCDRLEEYQVVKRYYNCTDKHEFKRQILAIYTLEYQCKLLKNPYEFCRDNVLATSETIQPSYNLLYRSI